MTKYRWATRVKTEVGARAFPVRTAILLALVTWLVPLAASAQVPPRFYWKSLSGSNGVVVLYQSISGNASPLDPAHVLSPEASFDAEIMIPGYARTMTLFNRAAMVAILEPMGRANADVSIEGLTAGRGASGFGDPMVEFTLNVVGPPAIADFPALIRYEPGFSLDLLVDLYFPIGEYDSDSQVNLGQNRWYGRFGAPIVWQLGAWVPGRRTTLEFLPSVWLFGDNDDFGGASLETDPKLQVEGHLTRDLAAALWGSFDVTWVGGGKSTIGGIPGESLDNLGVGFTLGYQLSEGLQMTVGYMASVNDSQPDDLRMDGVKVSLLYGWHRIIEGIERLEGGE